jgi:hypothetical protein
MHVREALYAHVKPGARFRDEVGEFRVMAVAEGWAMCRRKGCSPFVRSVRDIATRGTPDAKR